MKFFHRRRRCPRCGSVAHHDPNVHNTRVQRSAEHIAKLNKQLEHMRSLDQDADTRDIIDAIQATINSELTFARQQAMFADEAYRDADLLVSVEEALST